MLFPEGLYLCLLSQHRNSREGKSEPLRTMHISSFIFAEFASAFIKTLKLCNLDAKATFVQFAAVAQAKHAK